MFPPRNKLGITDPAVFLEVDSRLSRAAMFEILSGDYASPGRHSAARLTAIHQHLFGAHLYDAGKIRTQPLAKLAYEGYAARTIFTPPEQIEFELASIFDELGKADGLKGLSRLEFAVAAADVFGRCNQVHPFIEGNGRTQQTFIRLLARDAGHPVSFDAITRDRMYQASSEFSQGKPDAMREMFDELTCPVRSVQLAAAYAFLRTNQRKLGVDINDVSVSVCVPGKAYRGKAIISNSDTCIFYTLPHLYIANRADVRASSIVQGDEVPQFVATRSSVQEAHHRIDLAERAAGKGKRAAAITSLIAACTGEALAVHLQAIGPARIKAARALDRRLAVQR